MSISAIRPLQGQQAVYSLENRRKPEKTRSADRNAGPDTVSLSPEALALSKASRAAALQVESQPDADGGSTLPGWLTDMLSGGGFAGLPGLKDSLEPEDGLNTPGPDGLAQQDWEQLGQKLASILNAHGISGTENFTEAGSAANAFGKILQQELFRAISADPRFAGLATGTARQG